MVTECMYGDHAGWCDRIDSSRCYREGARCCATCAQHKTEIPSKEENAKCKNTNHFPVGHIETVLNIFYFPSVTSVSLSVICGFFISVTLNFCYFNFYLGRTLHLAPLRVIPIH